MILGSASYGVLVKKDPAIASAVAMGYVALILTIFVAVQVWRKP
jgi:hypothetical protein